MYRLSVFPGTKKAAHDNDVSVKQGLTVLNYYSPTSKTAYPKNPLPFWCLCVPLGCLVNLVKSNSIFNVALRQPVYKRMYKDVL